MDHSADHELGRVHSPHLAFRTSSPTFGHPSLVSAFSDEGRFTSSSPQGFSLEDPSYPPEESRFSSVSPPLFRLSEVCSPVPESETHFTPLDSSSPSHKDESSSFRLSDLSEPGYKLDLQSGQLQIHLDLSSGDVLNLSALPEGDTGSPHPEQDSSFIQPTYYEMSSTVSSMEDSESSQTIYPYFNSTGGSGSAPLSANSSSPYNLSNRYSDLYSSPSLYSQYYQSGYPSWAGAQAPGKQIILMFLKIFKKKLSLCHKLWFSYPYFYATQYHKPFKLRILLDQLI